jgi:hypothetical protein
MYKKHSSISTIMDILMLKLLKKHTLNNYFLNFQQQFLQTPKKKYGN